MNKDNLGFDDIIRKLSTDDNSNNITEDNLETVSTYQSLVSCITSLPSKQFVLLSTLIGILLIDNIDAKDQLILGKFINNIGQTIFTAAAQEQINKKDK